MASKGKKTTTPAEKHDDKISCLRCGTSNQTNFYMTKDPSRKYFGKIPYCKDCVKDFYDKYLKKYKDMNLAIYYLCRKIDIPYVHIAYTGAVETISNPKSLIKGEDAIVSSYIKGLSFSDKNGWGTSFDD